jgi:dolichol-phosphate mannosyltransferase
MKGGGAQNWPFHRKLISDTAHLLAKLVLGVKSSDSLSGFFAIRKDIFLRTRLRTKGYKLLLNILFDNPGIKVRDVPYFFSDRKAGKTKLGMGEMARFLSDLFSIRFG